MMLTRMCGKSCSEATPLRMSDGDDEGRKGKEIQLLALNAQWCVK